MKFTVRSGKGTPIEAEQLGSFRQEIQGQLFRFVITQIGGEPVTLTHRASGLGVATISHMQIAAAKGNYRDAGRLALAQHMARFGPARLRSVLAAAERA